MIKSTDELEKRIDAFLKRKNRKFNDLNDIDTLIR